MLNPTTIDKRWRFQWTKVLRIFYGKCLFNHTRRTKYAYSWWRKHSRQPTNLYTFLWKTHLITKAHSDTLKHPHRRRDKHTHTWTLTFTNTEPDEHTRSRKNRGDVSKMLFTCRSTQWWCWQQHICTDLLHKYYKYKHIHKSEWWITQHE